MLWGFATKGDQIEKAKSLLAEAYPNDDVDNLHIGAVELEKAGASYLLSLAADTIVVGPLFSHPEIKKWDLGMYMLHHEFQHRRQIRLADKLDKGLLEKGSAQHYQARLYHAQMEGGYLTLMTAVNKLAMYARVGDYHRQPIEKQANEIATISSAIGNTSGAAMWMLNEKLSNAFSAVAKPINTVAYGIERVTSFFTGNKGPKL